MDGTIVTSFDFSLVFRAVVLIAIAAWASLLAHMNISNFNDGARPVFPEFMAGRMSRPQFAAVVTGMGVGWVLSGFSQWVGTGLIAVHLILIATDIIGAWSPNKIVAILIGGAYGALCAFGTNMINEAFLLLPYNFLSDLTQITAPVLPIFCMYPAIAIAGQFDAKKGMYTALGQGIVYLVCKIVGKVVVGGVSISLFPYSFAMLAGMLVLIFFSVKGSKKVKSESVDVSDEENNLFAVNAERIKKNWLPLCIQGGLNALGIATLAQAYSPYVLSQAVLLNDYSVFYIAMIGVIIAFIPLIVSTALSTGVYQAVGLTTCMLVGALTPVWWLAPVLGFAVEFVEIQILGLLGKYLSKFPELSRSGDYIRNGMGSSLGIALTAGSFLAGFAIWGDIGLMGVGAGFLVNEFMGQKIPTNAVGPLSAAVVGIVYNVVIALGFVTLAV